jgi:hypothetical protein
MQLFQSIFQQCAFVDAGKTLFQTMKFFSFQAVFCTLRVIEKSGFYMVRAVTIAQILIGLMYIAAHNSLGT